MLNYAFFVAVKYSVLECFDVANEVPVYGREIVLFCFKCSTCKSYQMDIWFFIQTQEMKFSMQLFII